MKMKKNTNQLETKKLNKTRRIITIIVLVLSALAIIISGLMTISIEGESGETNIETGDVIDDENNLLAYLLNYQTIYYGQEEGLETTQVNAIGQTKDGYMWFGTYSGLYRYDGVQFDKITLDKNISSVMTLYSGYDERLWIGTNESGVFSYDISTGKVTQYGDESVIPSLSIRSLCVDKDGNMYVGTVSSMFKITTDDEIVVLDSDSDITAVIDMDLMPDGRILGVTESGILFVLQDDEIAYKEKSGNSGVYYLSAGIRDNNEILVGTTGNQIEVFDVENGKLVRINTITDLETSYYNDFLYDENYGGFFFCAENGMGFIPQTVEEEDEEIDNEYLEYADNEEIMPDQVTYFTEPGFKNSVSDVMMDNQGNVWFSSDIDGVVELAESSFIDIFSIAGIPETVANCTLIDGDILYAGTDSGLYAIDKLTYEIYDYDYLEMFEGERVRHIMQDSNGNLWISTYSENGLVKVSTDGSITCFNASGKNMLGGRFRMSIELSDGTIVAASNEGLNFISEDTVVSTLSQYEGHDIPQVLTMFENSDGELMIGTDGGGIFIIKDGEVIDRYDKEDGLESLVVLRIVPYDYGYFYVASNGIYLHTNGETIKRAEYFPYTNNYDIIMIPNFSVWVTSSAGIYEVNLYDMAFDNLQYNYVLLNYTRGLDTSLTANSWNTFDEEDGYVYLCCANGVKAIDAYFYFLYSSANYHVGINSIISDGEEIESIDTNPYKYVLPSDATNIEIKLSVLNYQLSNPLIHVYIEGLDDEGTYMYQKDLHALDYTYIPYGTYALHIEVIDTSTASVQKEVVYIIRKKANIFELPVTKVVIILLIMYLTAFMVYRIMKATVIRSQYEQVKEAKDEAERANMAKSRFLANMSHEIRTPINTIIGMDEMIIREDRSLDTKEYSGNILGYASAIKKASESLLGLVNDILDLSKVESGKMNLVEDEFDTADLIRSILSMVKIKAKEKDLMLVEEVDPNIPSRLYGDPGKIKQILLNLLSNSIKYTANGSVTFTAKLLEDDGCDCVIRYAVKDTGIGIKEEDMDKLFTAFERVDEKKNSGILGTGLGLNISSQFAALMGTEIKVESKYGLGSEFSFTLKQKIIDKTPIGEFKEVESIDYNAPYVPLFTAPLANIMVVDDNDMNLQVISNLLKATKVKIKPVTSGKECLNLLGTNKDECPYNMVLLDHMMPEMDGIETCEKIRENFNDLPVIALTANAATSGEDFYKEKGFDGYLAKPVDGRKLEETIKNYLPDALLEEPVFVVNEEQAEPESDKYAFLYDLKGIDFSEGVKNCGNRSAYLETIQTFYDTLEEKADELETAYNKEDWEFYTIKVHALKSSARIVGAKKLSELALSLEDAGKSGNIDFIKENTGTLLRMYREYLIILSGLSNDEEESTKEKVPNDMLEDAYAAFKEFAASMDYDSSEMVLDSLKEYSLPKEDAIRFKKIEVKLKELKWDEIVNILNER